MREAAGLLRIAVQLSVEDDFSDVALYHGTFYSNLPSIRSAGLSPRSVDADATIAEAVEQVGDAFGFDAAQKKELAAAPGVRSAKRRITESGFDKVYLSGDRKYAEGHVGASSEWYHMVIESAQHIAHADYYDLKYDYGTRLSGIHKEREQNDREYRSETDIEKQMALLDAGREIEKRYRALEEEQEAALKDRREAIKRHEKEVLRQRFGDSGVLLTVAMPYAAFVSKAVSSHTKQRIKEFEEQYARWKEGDGDRTWFSYVHGNPRKVWEFFQEVHLSKVEPRFIVKKQIVKKTGAL